MRLARTPNPLPTPYIAGMPKYEFCIPTVGKAVPAGADWFHEIKYDGYRLRVERDGSSVRLITRGGHDWTRRFPWIAEAALKNRRKQFVLDGEAVILGIDGIADFNALHSGKQNAEVQLCAFDVLAIDGDDVRDLPLSMRKANLDRLLRGRPDGIFINPFEIGAIGPDLFRAAREMGLEGLVSKRSDSKYRGGRSPYWIKVKNRTHQAFSRVADAFR
jgi:bifunctional non-homologous end joining protein LigD